MADNNYIIRESEQGNVYISEDVVATIVAEAVREVDGVAGFATSLGGEIAERLSKKPSGKGVKIAFIDNEVVVEAFVLVKYGVVISDVAAAVQETVASSVEGMTGVCVKAANVTICGIAFEKDK